MPIGDPDQFDKRNSVVDNSRATKYREYSYLWDRSDEQTKAVATILGYTKSDHDPLKLKKTL